MVVYVIIIKKINRITLINIKMKLKILILHTSFFLSKLQLNQSNLICRNK